MNTKLLRKIQKRILKTPEEFMMSDWACKTAACIGGWACHFQWQHADLRETLSGPIITHERAAQVLGLDDDYAKGARLFYLSDWPKKFSRQWDRAKTARGQARAAVNRIEHFIKTKGAE